MSSEGNSENDEDQLAKNIMKGGVYRILCTATNKACFDGVTALVYPIMLEDFGCLASGTFPNPQMVKDYVIYGANSFVGEILVCGPPYENREEVELALKKFKDEWSGGFY